MKKFFLISPPPSFSFPFLGLLHLNYFNLFFSPLYLILPLTLASNSSTRPFPSVAFRSLTLINPTDCSYICLSSLFSPAHCMCQCEANSFLMPFSSYYFPVQESIVPEALAGLSTPPGTLSSTFAYPSPHTCAHVLVLRAGLNNAILHLHQTRCHLLLSILDVVPAPTTFD